MWPGTLLKLVWGWCLGFGQQWNSHLLSTIGWEVEHQDSEEGDAHAGDDQVHRVEEGLTPHGDVECYVEVRLIAAGVKLHISKEIRFFLKFQT